MLQGILLVISVGLLWMLVGIVFSYVARNPVNFFAFIGVSSFLTTFVAWIIFPDYNIIRQGAAEKILPLSIVMISSGILNSIGISSMNKAMKTGHHGVIWTIGQSAMLIPFLAGIFLFRNPVTMRTIIGVLFIICAFLMLGRVKSSSSHNNKNKYSDNRVWILLSFFSFIILGLHQTLTTVPSYWHNWVDSANLRPPLIVTGGTLGYCVPLFLNRRFVNRKTLKFSLIISSISLLAAPIFYKSMDLLASYKLVPIVYPVAVSTAISGFSIYSIFILKEKASAGYIAGTILGIAGLLFIALQRV